MKNYIILFIVLFSVESFAKKSNLAIEKQKATSSAKKISARPFNPETTVIGKFKKYDREFTYLQVEGANQLIRIPNKYSLNHPSNYTQGLKLKMEIPLKEYLALNFKKNSKIQ